MKMKCDRNKCERSAEYVIATAKGNKVYLCKKHGRDLLNTLAVMKMERMEKL